MLRLDWHAHRSSRGMNSRNLKLAAAVPAIAMGLTLTLPVPAQTSGSGTASPPPSQQQDDTTDDIMTRAPMYDGVPTFDTTAAASTRANMPKKSGDLVGRTVMGDDGSNLGSISDLVIDSSSGKITHAVVASGGVLGIGADHKAVSFDSLQKSAGNDREFTLAANEWADAKEFREDQISTLQTAGMLDRSTSDAGTSNSLVLASNLDDLEIRNQEGREIGEVEDLIVQADEGRVLLLVEVDDDIAGDDRDFVLGLDRVSLGGTDDERILSTDLQESEFRTAAANETDTQQPYIWLDGGSERAVAE